MDYEKQDLEVDSRRFTQPSALPIVIGLGALALGFLAGGAAGWWSKPATPGGTTEVSVPRELSEAEKEAIWKPKVAEATANLEAAHTDIAMLEDQVRDKETQVKALQDELARRKASGSGTTELRKQLDAARADLADVQQKLEVALADKDRLTSELATATAALDDAQRQTRTAVQQTLDERWAGFVRQAELDVCEKGGKNKVANCRDLVQRSLTADVKAGYLHCVKAGQEPPALRLASRKEESLPQYSTWLGESDRATKLWYVELCDPTLPEATIYAEPATVSSTASLSNG